MKDSYATISQSVRSFTVCEIHAYPSEANFVSEIMESTNADLRVTDIEELGEAEAKDMLAIIASNDINKNIPLASASAGINDGLGSLNGAETSSVVKEQLIVSGGVKTTNVNVAVSGNAVLHALLEALHLTGRGEDGRNSLGNRWFLGKDLVESSLRHDHGSLGSINGQRSHSHLLGRGSGIDRAIKAGNTRSILTSRNASPEGSGRSGLGGRVGTAAVLETRDVRLSTVGAGMGNVSAARSEWDHGVHGHMKAIDASGSAWGRHLSTRILIEIVVSLNGCHGVVVIDDLGVAQEATVGCNPMRVRVGSTALNVGAMKRHAGKMVQESVRVGGIVGTSGRARGALSVALGGRLVITAVAVVAARHDIDFDDGWRKYS